MENTKYSNICKDYEIKLKEECQGEKIKEPYCDMLSTLLTNCLNFKTMKMKKQLNKSLKIDNTIK